MIALHEVCKNYRVHQITVPEWKKKTCGKGNAKKEDVAKWLNKEHKLSFEGDNAQDKVDAYCIALAGRNEYHAAMKNERHKKYARKRKVEDDE
jgi:Holliday junction resolvasome RuvABC endonuclease subunit